MLLGAVVAVGCEGKRDPRRTNFELRGPEGLARYDPETGRLKRIEGDINKDGRIETFGYWDGNRLIRIEIDSDEDGRIDRWEHYGELNRLTKIGSSSRDDGEEDTWAFPDASGFVSRVESDSDRDGRIDKREFYMAKPDAPGERVLSTVELDFDAAGIPQRRLHYTPAGGFERSEILR